MKKIIVILVMLFAFLFAGSGVVFGCWRCDALRNLGYRDPQIAQIFIGVKSRSVAEDLMVIKILQGLGYADAQVDQIINGSKENAEAKRRMMEMIENGLLVKIKTAPPVQVNDIETPRPTDEKTLGPDEKTPNLFDKWSWDGTIQR